MIKVNSGLNITYQEFDVTFDSIPLIEASNGIESDSTGMIQSEQELVQDQQGNLSYNTLTEASDGTLLSVVTSISSTSNTVACNEISATNSSGTVTKWSLISTTGTVLYTTPNSYSRKKTCTIDLTKLSIAPGTEFKLKANVSAGKDSTSSIIMAYFPASGISANFTLSGTAFKTRISYNGTSAS